LPRTGTGALFKFKPAAHRWNHATLRDASRGYEGFYLKIDGHNQNRPVEQVYIYLSSSDVAEVIYGWVRALAESKDPQAQQDLVDALARLTREGHLTKLQNTVEVKK